MDTPFAPEAYKDEYQIKLRALIETKISGQEVVAAESEGPGKVIDLMEALRASVEKANQEKEPEKPNQDRESANAKQEKDLA
jgi:DNA end-binding protein Ku